MDINDIPPGARVGLHRAMLAQYAPPGSIAARNDPNNDGSILSRRYPGLFGQFGASNPTYQASMAQYQARQRAPYDPYSPQTGQSTPSLRRGTPMNPMMSSMLMQEMFGGSSPSEAQENDGDEYGS